jgi:hypothetical protein
MLLFAVAVGERRDLETELPIPTISGRRNTTRKRNALLVEKETTTTTRLDTCMRLERLRLSCSTCHHLHGDGWFFLWSNISASFYFKSLSLIEQPLVIDD